MFSLVPLLSNVLPLIASSLVILVFAINLYVRIRRKFPVSVNCWFCNCWTKVPYDNWNSFDCPNCLQYNGFTKDGDYNKIIPEQQDEFMNKSTRRKSRQNRTSNGLCVLCNNNQQLKMFQLANFLPLVEDNYDREIDHFKEQLEKAYKLCRKCDKLLKCTIDKQNAWLFGRHVKNFCNNRISALNKFTTGIKTGTRHQIWSSLINSLVFLLVVALICLSIFRSDLLAENLHHLPPAYLYHFKIIAALANSSRVLKFNMGPYLPVVFKINPYLTTCLVGIILQVAAIILGKRMSTTAVNRLLCWIILLLNSWIHLSKTYALYILVIEIFSYGYLLYTSFSKERDQTLSPKPSGKAIRRLVKNLEHTCSYISDGSDFEDISDVSKSGTDSSDCFSKSTLSTVQTRETDVNLTTASSVLNSTFKSGKRTLSCFDRELNISLNNLHLGGLHIKAPAQSYCTLSVPLKRPKPVLSPPKLQTMNSWVAGGFWRNGEGIVMPPAQPPNCSRSSSESSGFGSQRNENWLFTQPKSGLYTDFDKFSMHSEFSNLRTSPMPTYFAHPEFGRSADFRNSGFHPHLQYGNVMTLGNRNFLGPPGLFSNSEPYQRKRL